MNKQSVAYVNVRNQTTFEDDPFDIGLSFKSQGLTMISHERQLELYAEELVSQHATYECEEYTLNLENLSIEEQSELFRLFLESIDREFETDAILGNDYAINSDYNCALLAMLENDNTATREAFSDVTRRNMITYYENSLQKALNEACESYLRYTNQEAGLRCHQDENHGDLVWSKV